MHPSDPIEDLKRAAELIRASTGERDPRCILVPASLWDRLKGMIDEQRRARRRGIDD